jgi:hypothetical protein
VGHTNGCAVQERKGCNSNNDEFNILKRREDVFKPLVKVLRLVDGDVKPSMGFLFGGLTKAKREVNSAMVTWRLTTRMSWLLLTRR